MREVYKVFGHAGNPRTPETDSFAEQGAKHLLLAEHPTAANIHFVWNPLPVGIHRWHLYVIGELPQ